jgi:hypothetical protein
VRKSLSDAFHCTPSYTVSDIADTSYAPYIIADERRKTGRFLPPLVVIGPDSVGRWLEETCGASEDDGTFVFFSFGRFQPTPDVSGMHWYDWWWSGQ